MLYFNIPMGQYKTITHSQKCESRVWKGGHMCLSTFLVNYAPLRRRGGILFCYCRSVGWSVCLSVGRPNGFCWLSKTLFIAESSYFTCRLVMTSRWPLLILGSLNQMSRSGGICVIRHFLFAFCHCEWQSFEIADLTVADFCNETYALNTTLNSSITGRKKILFGLDWVIFHKNSYVI